MNYFLLVTIKVPIFYNKNYWDSLFRCTIIRKRLPNRVPTLATILKPIFYSSHVIAIYSKLINITVLVAFFIGRVFIQNILDQVFYQINSLWQYLTRFGDHRLYGLYKTWNCDKNILKLYLITM